MPDLNEHQFGFGSDNESQLAAQMGVARRITDKPVKNARGQARNQKASAFLTDARWRMIGQDLPG